MTFFDPRLGSCGLTSIFSGNQNYGDIDISVRRPLETPEGRQSDHKTLLLRTKLMNSDRFVTTKRISRPMTKQGQAGFDQWLGSQTWDEISSCKMADQKASELVSKIDKAMDEFFPLKEFKVKSTDLPWMTPYDKKKIKSGKRI